MRITRNPAAFTGPRLGIDLGGTTIVAVVVNDQGEVCGRANGLTGDTGAVDEVLKRVAVVAREALAQASIPSAQLEAAGIGLPGEVDVKKRELRSSPILPLWHDVPVARLLEDELGVAFSVENDANAALLGECAFGGASDLDSVLLMTIGTGIGGALAINGQLWRGKMGSAGEIGHLCVDADGPLCWCGQRGCLGVVASACALIDYFRQLSTDKLPSKVDGYFVAKRFLDGDPAAQVAVKKIAELIARGIEMAACVFAPDRIVLHGGILNDLSRPLLDGIRKRLGTRHYPAVLSSIDVVTAELGPDAGAIGAVIIPDVV